MLTPDTAARLCMGCGNAYPPDPDDKMKGACPSCDGPLQLIDPMVAGVQSAGPGTPAVGPEAPPFGFGRFGPG